MPKLKTHQGTAKRVKISGGGKLLRRRANDTHFLYKKSEGRKRVLATKANIKGSIKNNLKRALGVGK
jgi:large subunit ribosomal protein L35